MTKIAMRLDDAAPDLRFDLQALVRQVGQSVTVRGPRESDTTEAVLVQVRHDHERDTVTIELDLSGDPSALLGRGYPLHGVSVGFDYGGVQHAAPGKVTGAWWDGIRG